MAAHVAELLATIERWGETGERREELRLLATIELHDRPYDLWRKMRRRRHLDEHAFTEMLERIPDLDLFLRFVELDGSTEGKNHEPIRWLKAELAQRGALENDTTEG